MTEREALIKIATVNAMDYEYQAWAREALAEQAPMHYYRADAKGNLERTDIHSAQPEQEPVATDWDAVHEKLKLVWYRELSADEGLDEIQDLINTTPPQRKPLSEEEIGAILEDVNAYGTRLYTFARAIEAKLKEKNT